jgi:hypothetical protein
MVLPLAFSACSPKADGEEETPDTEDFAAEFEVLSIDVNPATAFTGETVNITAVIENTGNLEGTYAAILTLNGAVTNAKEIVISPGSSRVASFSLTRSKPGTYKVGIGKLSTSLEVQERLIELSYDDGSSEGSCSSGEAYSFLVRFTPDKTPFVIKAVSIYAILKGTGYEEQKPEIEIRDQDFMLLSYREESTTTFSEFSRWVTIDVPDITVNGDFYVIFHTNSANYGGVYLYYDLSSVNENSDMYASGEISNWIWGHITREQTSWMIRVIGTTGL